MAGLSLRLRLAVMILCPLLVIAAVGAAWQITNVRATARDVFDRSLLAIALAVARDVALTGGDALSRPTRDLIAGAAQDTVFYQVYAPDGVWVTGYGTAPVPPSSLERTLPQPAFFGGTHLGVPVRAVRLREATEIDGLAGDFTVTVWRALTYRQRLEWSLIGQAAAVIGALVATVAVVVWFGIGWGLRPLRSLQNAISERGPDDLRPIRRAVPPEVSGLVLTLNRLFGQVSRSMEARRVFISNAAHQLRNPLAGLLAMAEAVQGARDPGERHEREKALVGAARSAADLANQLLLLERASAEPTAEAQKVFDASGVLSGIIDELAPFAAARRVSLTLTAPDQPLPILGDAVMYGEAVRNLITNALTHGGPSLSAVTVEVLVHHGWVNFAVSDDGRGIAPDDWPAALERFTQIGPGPGSGLGLSIVRSVTEALGGELTLECRQQGARVIMGVPLQR